MLGTVNHFTMISSLSPFQNGFICLSSMFGTEVMGHRGHDICRENSKNLAAENMCDFSNLRVPWICLLFYISDSKWSNKTIMNARRDAFY